MHLSMATLSNMAKADHDGHCSRSWHIFSGHHFHNLLAIRIMQSELIGWDSIIKSMVFTWQHNKVISDNLYSSVLEF